MKRESKFFLGATLIAVLAGGVPVYWQQKKELQQERELQALLTRPPTKATRVLRQALAACTEVRVHFNVIGSQAPDLWRTPATVATKLGKPQFVLRGTQMQQLIGVLHAESDWSDWSEPNPVGAPLEVTALTFYSGNRWVADIGLKQTHGLRWYTPLKYKGDALLLGDSRQYLDQKGLWPK